MLRDVVMHADGCFDAQHSAAGRPDCGQRDGSQRARPGHARRAQRGGAPQGTRNFDERSGVEVYGATPSSAAKEIVTHPKEHRGVDRMSGRRSPSGEPPEAPSDAATKSGDHLGRVERSAP